MAASTQPPPRRVPNTKLDWVDGFLSILRDTGNVRAATHAAQIDRSTAYKLRERDPSFANAWEEAIEEAADVLEAEARRRATIGVDEPVFYKGLPVGSVKRYSDSLLMFLLRGIRPDAYRDRISFKDETSSPREHLVTKLDELEARRERRAQ
jgi:hypothetical protein